jgi:hypothetical protein
VERRVFGGHRTKWAAASLLHCIGRPRWFEKSKRPWGWQAIALGGAALLLGGVAVWATDLRIKLAFPADRLSLALLLGAALITVGLLDLLLRPRVLKAALLALLIGLAVGFHYQNALSYRVDWNTASTILQQLIWRVPGIQPGTTLISEEFPTRYSTDNSLSAAINQIYAPAFAPPAADYGYTYSGPVATMPLLVRYLDLRLGWQLPELASGQSYSVDYRNFRFEGSSADVLLLYYQPPYCLRVLDPRYDAEHPHFLGPDYFAQYPEQLDGVFSSDFPQFPQFTIDALPYSNLALIETRPDQAASLPPAIFGQTSTEAWCYYFEQAELARQIGDWAAVAALGDEAFAADEQELHASELVVFIEGYAHVGQGEQSLELTQKAMRDGSMQPMLCAAWQRINATAAPIDAAVVDEAFSLLDCD